MRAETRPRRIARVAVVAKLRSQVALRAARRCARFLDRRGVAVLFDPETGRALGRRKDARPLGAASAPADLYVVIGGDGTLLMAARAIADHFSRQTNPAALAAFPNVDGVVALTHGTGHGVGYFLNVHEGPQSISKTTPDATMAMEPGMITSVEPGLYREGRWGVRIENLVLAVPAVTTEFGEFLEFETLTMCPIDTRCIERALLADDEVRWLNAYHATVRERLSPRVTGDARAWLEARTQPIG